MTPDLTAADAAESPEAGLTLVEMIIALAVSMLVVAFLAEGTGLLRHFSHVQRKISAQDEVLAVRDHLRRQIDSTMREQGELQRSSFAGVGDTAVFTAPGDRLLEVGGPVRITLTAVQEGGRMTLAESRVGRRSSSAKGRTNRLIAGAQRISFSYFGSTGGDATAEWASEWTDPEASPMLVRIDVAFPNGDERRWPSFIVYMPSGGAEKAQSTPPPTAAAPSKPKP